MTALLLAAPGRAWAWPPPLWQADDEATSQGASAIFPTPPALRQAIRFWRDIFTRHPSDRVVVHDRDNMDLIWRVIELPKDKKGVLDERLGGPLVKDAIEDLKLRLRRLSLDPTVTDEEDQVLLSLVGFDPARLQGAHERLRSQRGIADHFQSGLSRSRRYQEDVRRILAEEGVPVEIRVLPFVESMWNPEARSHVGAAGLWQLMPATARALGLKVGRGLDDRMDILKATRGAAKMLRQNYRMLGSWPLAITAYNHGPNGVRRAVSVVGSTDLATLIAHYEKSTWGFASKNFYAEFLAALAIVTEMEQSEPKLMTVDASEPTTVGP